MSVKSSLFKMTAMLSIVAATLVTSCKNETNEVAPQDDDRGARVAATTVTLGRCGQDNTIITSRTLTSGNTYILQGIVRVAAGATLTIEPGTLILGECAGTLVIERGARIIANGTPSAPIRFSSNKPVGQRRPGDWGGVIILGRAVNNQGLNISIEGITSASGQGQYGGTDDNDDSGIFRYVRIEYPGGQIAEGNEINGLTMGSVGRGTQIDHVQVLYTQDDGFEWFGGTVDAKYLYAFGISDDDFDTDFGFRGRIQFAAGVKVAGITSEPGTAQSNGFESDNDATGSAATPITSPVFSNVTLVGPCGDDALNPVFGQGVLVRRNSGLDLYNSAISEWTEGVDLCGANAVESILTRISSDATTNSCPEGVSFLANVLPSDCPRVNGSAPNLTRNPDLGSTVTLGGFFTTTNYRGAFSSTKANNNGWDLASENPSFNWLTFKAFGN